MNEHEKCEIKNEDFFLFYWIRKKSFFVSQEKYILSFCVVGGTKWHQSSGNTFNLYRNGILFWVSSFFFCVKIQQYNRFTCRWPNEDETVNRISIWMLHRIFEFSFLFVCHSLLLQMENGKIECSVKVLICMKMENCHKTINHFGFDVVTFRWQTSCPWTTLKTFNRRNVHSPKAYCSSSFFCGIFFLFSIW